MIRIFKIGGNVIDNPDALDVFIKAFSAVGGKKILVHGGGKTASAVSAAMGVAPKMVDGRRITDGKTLEIVVMVYAGLVSKTISARLNAAGCPAVGLCGADAGLVVSEKRAVGAVDYGFVGDPVAGGVNTQFLISLAGGGFVPVVAPITMDKNGVLLNTNADTVARAIAVALSGDEEVELVYCFEHNGVLSDINDEASVIPFITDDNYGELRENGTVSAGMIPKIDNAFDAVRGGVGSVRICNSRDLSGGTVIKEK